MLVSLICVCYCCCCFGCVLGMTSVSGFRGDGVDAVFVLDVLVLGCRESDSFSSYF